MKVVSRGLGDHPHHRGKGDKIRQTGKKHGRKAQASLSFTKDQRSQQEGEEEHPRFRSQVGLLSLTGVLVSQVELLGFR